jgi:cell division protein FtsB
MKIPSWNKATLHRNAVYAFILICMVMLVHEIFGQNGYLSLRRQKREFQNLQLQIKQLQDENSQLEKQIKALKSDPKAIERVAREQMRLARPGEIIYTLPEKGSSTAKAPIAKKTAPK